MIYLILLLMLLFVICVGYNIYLAKVELVEYRATNDLCADEDDRYKKLVKWHTEAIKEFYDDTVYVFAGEFNYEFYEKLLTDDLYDEIVKRRLKIVVIGGPKISVSEEGQNKIIDWAKEKKFDLYVREDQRTIGHGIVSEKSNKLCLVEDPHPEFDERGVTYFKNSPYFCDKLRIKARKLQSISRKIDDFSPKNVTSFTKTKREIKKGEKDFKDDARIQKQSYFKQNIDPLTERVRLKWLAQII